MAGKISLKGEFEEELIEALSVYSNFIDGVKDSLDLIDENEKLDHENDKIRRKTHSYLLSALESHNAKRYEDVGKDIIAACQALNSQEVSDLKDDEPRTDAKIKISIIQQNAINNHQNLRKLMARLFPGKHLEKKING